MPYYLFNWQSAREKHIAEHGITRSEFEEVVMDPDYVAESRSRGDYIAFGGTSTGKYIACVYEEFDDWVFPITAFEV